MTTAQAHISAVPPAGELAHELQAASPASARTALEALAPARPVVVQVREAPRALARIAVVVPCYQRHEDARLVLADLGRVAHALRDRVDLRVVLVDNASTTPLSTLGTPDGLRLEHLRLSTNTGGSGGFNAGLSRVLGLNSAGARGSDDPSDSTASAWAEFDPAYVWLVDSDARVGVQTLERLLSVLERDADIVAAGAAICDPRTGRVFELAGRVDRASGVYRPCVSGAVGVVGEDGDGIVPGDYVAAACALVRSRAIRSTGLMPDRFLNGDDVEWFVRMQQRTGGRVVGVASAIAEHPRFDRFPTRARFFSARSCLGPLEALGLPTSARLRRVACEAGRAAGLALMGRADLARLHVRGLREAALGRRTGPAPTDVPTCEEFVPLSELAPALARAGVRQGDRCIITPSLRGPTRAAVMDALQQAGVDVSPAPVHSGVRTLGTSLWSRVITRPALGACSVRSGPGAWCVARRMLHVNDVGAGSGPGFVLRRSNVIAAAARALFAGASASVWGVVAALRPQGSLSALDPAYRGPEAHMVPAALPSLDVIVLSYNRWGALERTLSVLVAHPLVGPDRIIVVDNASTDGSPGRVAEKFPDLRLVTCEKNLGVEAFNLGVAASKAECVLVLDDDAVPGDRALERGLAALAHDRTLGAVTLHPRHPGSGASEWPAHRALNGRPSRDWPMMGCGNLVRRAAWESVGGYEANYFLYRNDADLALKLNGVGLGVYFDPALVVWHDSPAGAGGAKSVRWHELATRNWIWMARRHGGGLTGVFGALLGWAWAHKLSGWSLARHVATLRGLKAGVLEPAPSSSARGRAGFARLVRAQVLGKH